ncbi:MAG: prolipoprotein diacylglyceryl transferase [Chloroflexota bacterium]|nr:prolipoprotein diacylglyceryl transferase [Chloroflexota bacterium]MDE3101370.1 prolipoprotein diacylglyceryl transferase [Chloroflexota bacterium]
MDIPFSPDLVVGAVRVSWHSIFSFVGALVATAISVRLSRYLLRDDRVYGFAIAVLVGGLFTAHIGNIADNWARYMAHPERILPFWGGIAVTAAPIGATIGGVLAARRLRLPVGFMLDVAAIGIVVGLAVGRVGDVINGEHHAVACSGLLWCVRYTSPDTLGQRHFVHPIVVYDGLVDLALAAVGYAYWRRVRGHAPEGRVYLLVLGLYGLGRALTSLLRLDPVVLGPLQEGQVLGILYACGALPALAVIEIRGSKRVLATRPAI